VTELPKPPSTHTEFVECYPELGRAWELIAEGGKNGPLDDDTARLVKLGVAIGAMREGSVHASVRKATAQGIAPEAIEQVVALSAGAVGLPAVVAAWTWVRDVLQPPPE
jgi:4-carboxymuconolactone decarboxylase